MTVLLPPPNKCQLLKWTYFDNVILNVVFRMVTLIMLGVYFSNLSNLKGNFSYFVILNLFRYLRILPDGVKDLCYWIPIQICTWKASFNSFFLTIKSKHLLLHLDYNITNKTQTAALLYNNLLLCTVVDLVQEGYQLTKDRVKEAIYSKCGFFCKEQIKSLKKMF